MKRNRLYTFFGDFGNMKQVAADLVIIGISSILSITYNSHIFYAENMNSLLAGLFYAMKYIPIILVTALGGAVPGMISMLIVFAYRSLMYSSFSFMTFIYLVVACLIDVFSKRGYFKKWQSTFICAVILQLVTGVGWSIILILLSGSKLQYIPLRYYPLYFLNEIPGCMAGCFLVYLIFKKIPDDKKLLFGNGKYYVDEDMLTEDQRFAFKSKSKIGLVVTQVIVFEAIVLGVSAELASNTLVPSMNSTRNTMVQTTSTSISGYYLLPENAEELEKIVSLKVFSTDNGDASQLKTAFGLRDTQFSVKLAMLISIIVIPLAVFVNRYAQRRIAEPIRNLSKAVTDIYMSNDTDINKTVGEVHNLNINTDDEIEELYHSVDLTFYRLMEYIELVKTRQNIEDQLRIEKSANEAKSRFLSNISHEIRTPINAVLGFDEMILRESKDEAVLSYAADIQNAGRTLLTLINDILDFSKIEAGKMEIIPVEYELRSMINDVVNMASVRINEKNLDLILNIADDIPHILFGDEIRIKQCIINIMTNAAKYTEVGSVTLDINWEKVFNDENEEDYDEKILLKVKVTDTGIGIKEEDLEKLSTAFERIDEKRNRTIEGTGLGINIVNSLLDMMGSKLQVKSEYGKGSEFSFELVQRVVDAEAMGNYTMSYEEARAEAQVYKESFHAPDARILVVDDTRTNLTVIQGLLKQTKIQIDTATSGVETLGLVTKNVYDMIFLDHRMPEMDGIQTFHAMEELTDNLNKKTPVIALTANAISGSREMYFKEGFTNYMSKPVDPGKLEEMILTYLPEYKVSRPGDAEFVADEVPDEARDKEVMQEMLKISGIDMDAAIARCGSVEVARDVMKDFRMAIDERAGLIEKYWNEGNIKNYTIYVHGLKSSARAIGATDLSEKAEYLEKCGNEGNIDEINALTTELLQLYRSYYDRLSVLSQEDDSDKPLIGEEELEGAFASIKEFVSGSYFDSADDIMKMLEDYRIPDNSKQKYREVKRLLAAVDRDGLLNIL